MAPGAAMRSGAVFRQALWLALGMGLLLWFAVRHAAPLIRSDWCVAEPA